MRPETRRKIGQVGFSLVALSGAVLVAQGTIEADTTGNYEAIKMRVKEVVPGYNPEAFESAQQVIVDFREKEDLTSKTIEVPESVRQAANHIEDHQTIYDQGNQVAIKEANKRTDIFISKSLGGIATIIGGLLGVLQLQAKRNKQLPEIQPASGVPSMPIQ